mmetsp:Transcript_8010/g.19804  ORF Transcript_8010/g.19804 Transcript_8010/m.19804 type:complete len:237 (+) Transcript_8010:441-1151(+)
MPTSPSWICIAMMATVRPSANSPATTRHSATAPKASRTDPCNEGRTTASRLNRMKPQWKVYSMAASLVSSSTRSTRSSNSGITSLTFVAQVMSSVSIMVSAARVRFWRITSRSELIGSCCGWLGGIWKVDAFTPSRLFTSRRASLAPSRSSVALKGGPSSKPEARIASRTSSAIAVRLKSNVGFSVVHIDTGRSAKQPSMTLHIEIGSPSPTFSVCWAQKLLPKVEYGLFGTSTIR